MKYKLGGAIVIFVNYVESKHGCKVQ